MPSQRRCVSAGLQRPRMPAGNVRISYWPKSGVCIGAHLPHWTARLVIVPSLQELDCDILEPQGLTLDGTQALPTKPRKRRVPTRSFSPISQLCCYSVHTMLDTIARNRC